jgi:hypothetical protein
MPDDAPITGIGERFAVVDSSSSPQTREGGEDAPGTVDLLWCSWFVHSRMILYFLLGWIACVWLIPLVAHPGWILAFGVFYALLAGPAFGGGDVINGCEEFTLSLPAGRSSQYWANLGVGLGVLLLFTALDGLALGLDLSQALLRFFVDTGLIQPQPLAVTGLLAGLVFSLPLAVFSFAFVLAANAHSRAFVLSSWFWGGLGALGVLKTGLLAETWRWGLWNGWISNPLLAVASVLAIWLGHHRYCAKELGPPVGRLVIPGRWWLWLALGVFGLGLVILLLDSLARDFSQFLGRH